MNFLLQVFTAMKTDAESIRIEATTMKGKIPTRCRILFDHLKENADRLKNVSTELITFYKSAESDFISMKNCKGKLSFVGKWKEYLKIEKMTLLSKIMQWLKPVAIEEINQEL
jgi:hypothetical protein